MSAIDDVAAERVRQIEEEGYDAAHDDAGAAGDLAKLAMRYVHRVVGDQPTARPLLLAAESRPRDGLVIAAALICAEIDRLDRAVGSARAPAGYPGEPGSAADRQRQRWAREDQVPGQKKPTPTKGSA